MMRITNAANSPNRRQFLVTTGRVLAATTLAGGILGGRSSRAAAVPAKGENRGRIFKAIKFPDFREKLTIVEKFRLLKEMGFDGVEVSSPGGADKKETLAASRETGLPVHGAVNSIHWGTRLSDPSADVREKAVAGLETSIRETHAVGGNSVLLVPGRVTGPNEDQDKIWDRSIAGIKATLPLCAHLGVRVLIENVWNGFCYIHDGPNNQTADKLGEYIDAIGSPWVGVYFDIGNHQKYGKPEEWIRTLGRRIVKLDAKDWGGPKATFVKNLGDGDVNWPAVRSALKEIGFTGWATAEMGSGDRKRMADLGRQMDVVLGL